MEEKVIIKSERYDAKKFLLFMVILGIASSIGIFFVLISGYKDPFKVDLFFEILVSAIILIAFLLIGIICYFWFRNYELVVTDKRIYGKVAFGKQVDLPVDSISAIASITVLKGVSVATSSGKISFLFLKNAEEIRNELSKLIIQRQKEKDKSTPLQTTINQVSNADELKKYKQLLDDGIITQEEFEVKKKQILGL